MRFMNSTGSTPCQSKWLGSKLKPNAGPAGPPRPAPAGWSRSRRRSRSGGPRARSAPPRRRTRRGSGSSARRSPRTRASIIDSGVDRREHGHGVPDRRPGEARPPCRTPKRGRGPGGVRHLGGRPLAHPLGIAVAPDPVGQDAPGAARRSGGRTPPARRGGCEIAQQRRPYLSSRACRAGQVAVLGQCAVNLEVVSPAGQLEAVVSPGRWPARQTSSSGRSAHWPVNKVNECGIVTLLVSSMLVHMLALAAGCRCCTAAAGPAGPAGRPRTRARGRSRRRWRLTRSRAWWVNVCSQPSTWPGGHQARSRYGWPGSVTRMRRNPAVAAGSSVRS